MESPGLLSLPLEILHHITRYISEGDIISCSQTCRWLKIAMNDNQVWKRYLPEQDLSMLQSIEPQVRPALQEDQTLCENRVHLMRKTHLLSNWKNERFVNYRLSTYCNYIIGFQRESRKGKGQVIYKDSYIFLGSYSFYRGKIQVWDIRKNPVLHTIIKVQDRDYDTFFVIGNYFVVIKHIEVCVYEITVPETVFPLVYSFNHIDRYDTKSFCWSSAGNYLILSVFENDRCAFHVWDIVNASKVGYFYPPIDVCCIYLHSHQGNDWILEQRIKTLCGGDNHYARFNILKKEFSDLVFKCDGYIPQHVIFYNSHVIVFQNAEVEVFSSGGRCDTVCAIYDFQSSEVIARRYFRTRQMLDQRLQNTIVVNGKFVILCVDGFYVIDALSLETVSHFRCDDGWYISNQFDVFGSLFVITRKKSSVELWDIDKKKALSISGEFIDARDIYISDLCTKLFYTGNEKISVLHFW